ncbi:Ribonuclease E [Candidatus Burkholderia brachyanthoides]|nr:Ribonuclease E [Candidatus Burkholderia brachyanthoides]
MKRMLFNATQQEELRVAIVDGQKLIDIDIETAGREQRKGNIYKGVVTRIEPSLEACFVNYGEDRHGFLPFKEVARQYFRDGVEMRSARIQDALREGQELIVQVEKEERGNKGAALTTFISLAGRYLVLMPNNPRGGGVSRRIEGDERQELRETMAQLELPEGMSIIARTAGIGRSAEELQWDLNYLMQLWRAIEAASQSGVAGQPMLIYLESSLVIRAIRDYFQPDIGEILIDTTEIHDQARAFMDIVMPDNLQKVKRYHDDVPLFSRFQIEHQIETAYSRTVPLPSGGAIVIDHTEALVAIDVNSARATKGEDIEETATRTNLEAADEVARQLRLRDLGGLIVIDFIDMESAKSQREVEQRLKDALKHDRARVQMGKISRFGLMELSRQRLRPALSEGSHVTCPRCNGTGHIRDTESSALQVLRIIQEEAMKEHTAAIHCQVPVEVTAFLLNEKRSEINKIESRFKVNVVLIPNKHLETPHYKLERLRHDDAHLDDPRASWKMAVEVATDLESETGYSKRSEEVKPKQEAVVKGITPEKPAPSVPVKPTPVEAAAVPVPTPVPANGGFIAWIKNLFGIQPKAPAPVEVQPAQRPQRERSERTGGGDRNRNRRGGTGRDGAAVGGAAAGAGTGGNGAGRQGQRREDREARERNARQEGGEHQERRERPDRAERGERRKPQPDAVVEALRQGETVPSEIVEAAQVDAEGLPTGADASPEGAGDGEERRRRSRRRSRRGGRRERKEDGMTVNHAADVAEAEGSAESLSAQAGVFDAEAAQEAAARREPRPVAVPEAQPVVEQAQAKPVEAEPLVAKAAEAAPAPASAAEPRVEAEPEPVETKLHSPEQAPEFFAKPSAAPSIENPFSPTPKVAEAPPVDLFAPVAPATVEAPKPVETAQPMETPAAPVEAPAKAEVHAADLVKIAVIAPTPETTSVVPAEPIAETTPVVSEQAPAAVETAPQAPEAPKAPEAPRAVPAVRPAQPMSLETLQPMLENAGLVWVNTDADKLREASAAAAREPAPIRVPRERKSLPPVDPTPMQQVETSKTLH